MNKDLTKRRLEVLEGHIRKDMDLLEEYEDELRHETDLRHKEKYRREIERQRESLTRYQQEYDELQKQVTSAEMQGVADLLQQKGAKLDEIQKLLPPVWNVPHIRNPNFTGREDILSDLRLALTSGEPAAWKQAALGMGGVGKTQLAVEYIYRHKPDYRVIWWIRSEKTVTMAADYASLAVDLNLPEKDSRNQTDMVRAVKRWLEHNPGWLLIFDNAQDPGEVRDYLPMGGAGHLIITSRNPNWSGVAKLLPVQVFDRADSIDFLCKRTGQDDRKAADTLADELGDLPLALEHAGAYIETTGRSISDYLKLFGEYQQELLSRAKPSEDCPCTVATTWEISFQEILKESPTGADLLNLCAYLAPDNISRELLIEEANHLPEPLASAVADPLSFDDAVSTLRRYSLIEVTADTLSVHRLVQAVVRDRIEENGKKVWAEAAVCLLSDAFPIKSDDPESIDMQTWLDCSRLLPHALSASGHAEILEVAPRLTSNLLNQAGSYLRERADLYEAKEAHERALKLAEAFYGKNHPHVAICLENLGRVLRDQGDLKGAKKQLERALNIDEAFYGLEHPQPHVAICVDNLGRVLDHMGELAAAKEHFERALKIDKVIHGPNHFKVAIRLNNIGTVLQEQGDLEAAKEHYERALKIDKAFYGENHPYVAIRLNNIGTVLQEQGDLEAAKEHCERALKIDKAFYGSDNPHVAISLSNLGGVLQDLGDLQGAKEHFERALKIDEDAYGRDHPEVATDVNNLGSVLQDLGDLQAAKECYERALEIFRKSLCEDHPYTATVRDNLRVLADL